jgi:hypothetical protein
MFPDSWTRDQIIEHCVREILIDQKKILDQQEKQMSALTDLQAAVTKLDTDVKAFVTANSGGATDAQLAALTASVDAIDAIVNPPAPAPPAGS